MPTNIELLSSIENNLMSGNLSCITQENIVVINNIVMNIFNRENNITQDDIVKMGIIMRISNIMYNNTDKTMLPLEDGVYDILIVLYSKYNPNYMVGAQPIMFESTNNTMHIENKTVITPASFIDRSIIEKSLFINELGLLRESKLNPKDFIFSPAYFEQIIEKKSISVPHVYPKLVGTLDKCKFVLNQQARDRGVFDNSNVKVFERDFLGKHLAQGIFNQNDIIALVLELKYDGVSVEAEVSDYIQSARSRGDANADIAADLTPIFKDYPFKQAIGIIPEDEVFGMQFEAILDNQAIEILNIDRVNDYKNARNAIIGILGSLDGYKYRDLITLVPLTTSIEDINRVEEIEFLNKYYRSKESLRYVVIEGKYIEVLYQVKKFVEEAEYMRQFLPFMYDGIVVSYLDQSIRKRLGRINSVNQYSMAIKFNAMKKQSVFLGYTFTIGATGNVTPMINFKPVEFFGTIHMSETGHSYARFKELNLKPYDIIDIEYQHDVMCYITKPDLQVNRDNTNEPAKFIEECPFCGSKIEISESGKNAVCPNRQCPERNISRMVNMMQKLNVKDFAEEKIKAIARYSISELFELTLKDVEFLGEADSKKFISRMDDLKTIPISDYKIIGSIGFSNIAIIKWKLILQHIKLEEILFLDDDSLREKLVVIKGIGNSTADTIIDEREMFMNDLFTIFNMNNVTRTFCSNIIDSPLIKVRFSGFRDPELSAYLESMNIDANLNASCTTDTTILLVPFDGYTSDKTDKAIKYGIRIVSVASFKENMSLYLGM